MSKRGVRKRALHLLLFFKKRKPMRMNLINALIH